MSSVQAHIPGAAAAHDIASLYRSVFERSTDGIAIIAPDGTYVEQNAAHARMLGWTMEELRGRTPAIHLGEEAFQRVRCHLEREGYFLGEVESRDRAGRVRVIELAAFAVHDRRGAVIAYVGSKRDVTQRRAAEMELRRRFDQIQAIYRMTAALSRAADLHTIFAEGLDCLCDAFLADRSSLLLCDTDGVMRFVDWRNLSDEYRRAVDGHSPWRAEDVDAAPVLVTDVLTDPRVADLRAVIAGEGIRALAFVPLRDQQRLLGKFMIYYNAPHAFTDEEVRVAETIASHIALAIVRNRDLEELARREREFEALAEHSPDIIVRFDRDLRYLYINPVIESLTGRERSSFIGRTNEELGFTGEVRDRWENLLERVFATGQPGDIEFAWETPRGTRHFLGRARPEIVEEGTILTVVCTTRDVTELKRAEFRQRLLAEVGAVVVAHLDYRAGLHEVARLVVNSFASGCAIDLATPEGRLERLTVTARNPEHAALVQELERRYPTPMEGIAGHVTAFRTGAAQLYPELPDELLRAASFNDEHFRMWRALQMRACICAPLMARGRTIGVITFVAQEPDTGFDDEDFTFAQQLAGRVALAVDNLRLYEESAAANRTKSNFMATMSHELRTPLNAIMGYADLLEMRISGPLTDLQAEQLERIRSSTSHLLTVIEEILTFSRVEAGKEELHLEATDVGALVRQVSGMMEAVASQKGLSFESHVPPRPLHVRTDPVKLRQVLLNLLGNAVKFTDQGSISIAADEAEGELWIHVSDTGIGLAPEHLDRVFDPFWQVDASVTRRLGGTGLGLTVSRQLVTLMGGDLSVASQLGRGSRFTVRLPLQPPCDVTVP